MKKVFIITGANRGLGKAFVDALIKDADNFIISISRRRAEDQLGYSPNGFHFIEADLAEENLGEKLAVLNDLIGKQEIFFLNNASIIEPIVTIEELNEEDIDRTISVNIKATLLITKYLLRHFKYNTLSFVNISSGAADRPIGNWSLYCASKAFVKMFFKVAECEYEQHRFFNIDPGVMDTMMQKSVRDSDFPDVSSFQDLEKEGKLKAVSDVATAILKTIS
ncbi:SDR family NAD(P)-dependent oxidoreductase [Maribacter sp.]|nr:SDR family NAD(P)-dependent oxidoreductase [Maribacter sp.]